MVTSLQSESQFMKIELESLMSDISILVGEFIYDSFPGKKVIVKDFKRNEGSHGGMSIQFKLILEVDGVPKTFFVKSPKFLKSHPTSSIENISDTINPQRKYLRQEDRFAQYLHSKDKGLFDSKARLSKPKGLYEGQINGKNHIILISEYLEGYRTIHSDISAKYSEPNMKFIKPLEYMAVLLDLLAAYGVHNMDLKLDNIMWSDETQLLYMIDLSSIYFDYLKTKQKDLDGFVSGGMTAKLSPLPVPADERIEEDFIRFAKNNFALILLKVVFGKDCNPYKWQNGRILISRSDGKVGEDYDLDFTEYNQIGDNVKQWASKYLGYIEVDTIMLDEFNYQSIYKEFVNAIELDNRSPSR